MHLEKEKSDTDAQTHARAHEPQKLFNEAQDLAVLRHCKQKDHLCTPPQFGFGFYDNWHKKCCE